MMTAVDVTDILKACQSPDASQRQHGEAKLKELESDPSTFFQALSSHLATPINPVDTRKLSGTIVFYLLLLISQQTTSHDFGIVSRCLSLSMF